MEACKREIGFRSLEDYYDEARKLIRYFNRKKYLKDDDIVGEVVNTIIKAENEWEPKRGQLSTVKFSYVKNFLINVYYKKQTKKNQYTPGLNPTIECKLISAEDICDYKYIIDYVSKSDFSPNQKFIFQNYYLGRMSQNEIAKELNLSVPYVNTILTIVLNKLRDKFYVE